MVGRSRGEEPRKVGWRQARQASKYTLGLVKFSSRGESRQSKFLESSSGRRVMLSSKHNFTGKVQQNIESTRFTKITTRPDNITVIEVGENVGFEKGEERRMRKKPRKDHDILSHIPCPCR
jgi:hypothetical protein